MAHPAKGSGLAAKEARIAWMQSKAYWGLPEQTKLSELQQAAENELVGKEALPHLNSQPTQTWLLLQCKQEGTDGAAGCGHGKAG